MRRDPNGAPTFPFPLGTLCFLTTSSTHSLSASRLSRPCTNLADLMLPFFKTNSLLRSPSATSLRQVRTASHFGSSSVPKTACVFFCILSVVGVYAAQRMDSIGNTQWVVPVDQRTEASISALGEGSQTRATWGRWRQPKIRFFSSVREDSHHEGGTASARQISHLRRQCSHHQVFLQCRTSARNGGRVGGDQRDTGAPSRTPTNFRGCRRWVHPMMPGLIPAELCQWIEDRQSDLQEAFVSGDTARVLELTSKMAEGAEQLREITCSRMVP